MQPRDDSATFVAGWSGGGNVVAVRFGVVVAVGQRVSAGAAADVSLDPFSRRGCRRLGTSAPSYQ
eukprot:3868296-Pyramimonas_sp.AAC.1